MRRFLTVGSVKDDPEILDNAAQAEKVLGQPRLRRAGWTFHEMTWPLKVTARQTGDPDAKKTCISTLAHPPRRRVHHQLSGLKRNRDPILACNTYRKHRQAGPRINDELYRAKSLLRLDQKFNDRTKRRKPGR